ncbi:hypothetical protein MTR67_004828 [Solanum verrucosum]|uniref:Uncharacterized protein n=1 Tax=Solanum verrucosum TaxID=315347 RepID=A0AAF0PUT4_SOLVR|nr:hypothetical protein MTR67_004828 [Solanum verrucosum]
MRRRPSVVPSAAESSVFGKSQPSLVRSQQQSQQSFSQGFSSQQAIYSQLSQSTLDDFVPNEQRLGSQERENSAKRMSCLPHINYTREETQMQLTKPSTNYLRKWSVPESKYQIEELEHKIGMVETSLSRQGMILDSIQSDIMQVNRGTKEILMEMESLRPKLVSHDELLQLMIITPRQDCHGQKHETAPVDPPKVINDCSPPREVKFLKKDQKTTTPRKIEMGSWTTVKINQTCMKQKIPIRNHTENEAFQQKIPIRSHTQNEAFQQKIPIRSHTQNGTFQQERGCRITIESDEDIDVGFSCLLEENGTGNLHFLPASFIFEDFTISKTETINRIFFLSFAKICVLKLVFPLKDPGIYPLDDAKEESARILRKARRRKRKHFNTIIID